MSLERRKSLLGTAKLTSRRLLDFGILVFVCWGCGDQYAPPPYDTEFEIPRTVTFSSTLASYGLYQEPMAALVPAQGVHEYELASGLFTDHASKQRLLKLPEDTVATVEDDRIVFPDGTIIAKTFYYEIEGQSQGISKQKIETRLLVKRDGLWNVATYVWDNAQTTARLRLDGAQASVTYLDTDNNDLQIQYQIPHEGECVTCHQLDGNVTYIGPTLANLSRPVMRNGQSVDQILHLFSIGVLAEGDYEALVVPDYNDSSHSIEARARAYLDINCAHCHQPSAWSESAEAGIDFRYQTSLSHSGILENHRPIQRMLNSGQMPYLGTTVKDETGVALVLRFLQTL